MIEDILDELVARHGDSKRVHLNDIAEVIGLRAVTYEEVDELIGRLEDQGFRVGEPLDQEDLAALRAVLDSARDLARALGRRPTAGEIAERSGQPIHTVRRALEHGAGAARQRTPQKPDA